MSSSAADVECVVDQKRGRGRPPKDVKLVRYAVLWLAPDVADALSAECGNAKRAAVVREFVVEGLRARGRLPVEVQEERICIGRNNERTGAS